MKELLKRIASIIVSIGLKMLVYYWLIKLAKKYDTSVPKVRFTLKKDTNTLATYNERIICIDVHKHLSFKTLKITAYHEYRHHWQWTKRHDIFQWWTDHYKDAYCIIDIYSTIEIDAYRFGNSLGSLDDNKVFTLMPLKAIEKCYSDGSLEEACHRLALFLNQCR